MFLRSLHKNVFHLTLHRKKPFVSFADLMILGARPLILSLPKNSILGKTATALDSSYFLLPSNKILVFLNNCAPVLDLFAIVFSIAPIPIFSCVMHIWLIYPTDFVFFFMFCTQRTLNLTLNLRLTVEEKLIIPGSCFKYSKKANDFLDNR